MEQALGFVYGFVYLARTTILNLIWFELLGAKLEPYQWPNSSDAFSSGLDVALQMNMLL